MTLKEFKASLSDTSPPEQLNPLLRALWHERHNDWDRAHGIVQALDTPAAALIHAHLHRVEGDEGNAGYWYARAGRPFCRESLDEEWNRLVGEFLTVGGTRAE